MNITIRPALTPGSEDGLSVHIVVWPEEAALHTAPLLADLGALAKKYGATLQNNIED